MGNRSNWSNWSNCHTQLPPKTRFSLKRTATLSVFYCCHGGESCYRRPFQHILGLNLYLESGAKPRVAAARSMDSRQQLAGLPTHKQLLSFTLYFNSGSIRFWQDLQSTAMVPLICFSRAAQKTSFCRMATLKLDPG